MTTTIQSPAKKVSFSELFDVITHAHVIYHCSTFDVIDHLLFALIKSVHRTSYDVKCYVSVKLERTFLVLLSDQLDVTLIDITS